MCQIRTLKIVNHYKKAFRKCDKKWEAKVHFRNLISPWPTKAHRQIELGAGRHENLMDKFLRKYILESLIKCVSLEYHECLNSKHQSLYTSNFGRFVRTGLKCPVT